MVRPARVERATPGFGGRYSIQLSYGRTKDHGSLHAGALARKRVGEMFPQKGVFHFSSQNPISSNVGAFGGARPCRTRPV